MKFRLVVVAAAVGIALGLKRHYADARAEDLVWILGPTSHLAGAMTGTRFVFQAGEGYFSREQLFLIAKACAGVNFMVAAFGMVTIALLHRVRSLASAAGVLGTSLVASYAAAVLVNAARIVAALWLAAHPVSALAAADVHRVEGIVVYFGGLVLLYAIVRRLDEGDWPRAFQWAALPLASYYAVTLAIPFAAGASQSSAFLAHAAVVAIVPVLLIAAVCAVWAAVSFFPRGPYPSHGEKCAGVDGSARRRDRGRDDVVAASRTRRPGYGGVIAAALDRRGDHSRRRQAI